MNVIRVIQTTEDRGTVHKGLVTGRTGRVYGHEVPRNPKTFVIDAVQIRLPDNRTPWIRTGPDAAIPEHFAADVWIKSLAMLVTLTIRVSAAGKARVVDLKIEVDPRSESITTSLMRQVLVDPMLRAAVSSATTTTSGIPAASSVKTPSSAEDRIQIAADVYTAALESGSDAPTEAVATRLGYSRPQASRYVRMARDRGLIQEQAPRRPRATNAT